MAWMSKMGPGTLTKLHNAFAKQPSMIGRMTAPPMKLDPGTMTPRASLAEMKGSGSMPSGGSMKGSGAIQSPAQHAAVEKAALASAAKRKKKGFL